MMLPTGITELQSINDVGYLRQTLAVEKTDEEALAYFQVQREHTQRVSLLFFFKYSFFYSRCSTTPTVERGRQS